MTERMGERGDPCGIPISVRLNEFEVELLMTKETDRRERKDLSHLQILEGNPK